MAQALNNYRQMIRQRGYRVTPQRQIILDALSELTGHRTPDEVYSRVQRKTTAINRATVYRTLDFLLRMGLVTVAQLQDNQTVYEVVNDELHHHLVCQKCEHIIQLDYAEVQPLFDRIKQEQGFQVRTNHLVLFGVCQDCLNAELSGAAPN